MNRYKVIFIGLVVAFLTNSWPVMAEHSEDLPEMTIQGKRLEGFDEYILNPDMYADTAPDSADLLRRVPGASFNDNGPISGQAQYRGMYGPRMNVRVDGMYMNSGGPNWMDPPLHYLPRSLIDTIEVYRGIAPVSTGSGIGGYIEARTRTSKFTSNGNFEFHGDVSATGRSVDNGYSVGGLLSYANRNHRMHFLGDFDEGGDLESGSGDILATEHQRDNFGFGYGYQNENQEIGIDYRHQDTGHTGTPSLPLDIAFFDTEMLNSNYRVQLGKVNVEAGLDYMDVNHQMDNFSLRTPTDFFALNGAAVDPRFVNASSNSLGYSLKGTMPFARGDMKFGFDGKLDDHDATVFNPDQASFFVTNFNNASSNEYSFFVETQQQLNKRFNLQLGLRYTRVEADADRVDAIVTPAGTIAPPVAVLRDAFNSANRSKEDNNVDWVIKLGYRASENLTVDLGVARKTRSPNYIERYAWIPLEINAGLGDGNNYVGNLELDPEVSHQVELGLDWQYGRFYFSPRGYYRRVDDYIQGIPSTDPTVNLVGGVNGDATPLQFTNVDAELYGVDANWGVTLNDRWYLNGIVSYVRGKRRDIDDNLYRIAPLNANLDLTYHSVMWEATMEGVFVARQRDISDTNTLDPANSSNNNKDTPGYVLLNLYGKWRPTMSISLTAGIDNVLDRDYANHLSGFNRVTGSDVPVGVKVPGPGRNLFATVSYEW